MGWLHLWLGRTGILRGQRVMQWGSVGYLALLHTPRAAAACPWGQPHCPGRRKGLRISSQGHGTLDTTAAIFGFPPRCSPSNRLPQTEWHQHRLQGLHRGQQGEPRGSPCSEGEQEGLGQLFWWLNFPGAPNYCHRGF